MNSTVNKISKTDSTLPVFELTLDEDEEETATKDEGRSAAFEFSDFSRDSAEDESYSISSLISRVEALEEYTTR